MCHMIIILWHLHNKKCLRPHRLVEVVLQKGGREGRGAEIRGGPICEQSAPDPELTPSEEEEEEESGGLRRGGGVHCPR